MHEASDTPWNGHRTRAGFQVLRMTPLIPVILLTAPSCCPEPRVIHVSRSHPPLSIATATNPDSSLHSSGIFEKKAGVPSSDNAASILSLRKQLNDVRSELKG